MTRLKENDICRISSGLEAYNQTLITKTGRTLRQIACHACCMDETVIRQKSRSFLIHVVPITAGQGIITKFSETVVAILKYLGLNARVADKPDASGVAHAFEHKADAVMMADDHRFVGINLATRSVVDNTEATGVVFAAAMDLMAGGIRGNEVVIIGCGPVGEAAARKFLSLGAGISLFDSRLSKAQSLKQTLDLHSKSNRIKIVGDLNRALSMHQYILEATPSRDSISDSLISDHMRVAAPGVPLGISDTACGILKDHLVHDKLELGVAAMAVSLLS